MKTRHHKVNITMLAGLLSTALCSGVWAQSSSEVPPPPVVDETQKNAASERAGLSVNETRIKGRRDGVVVRHESGTSDYYDDKRTSLGADDGELGEHSTLRLWRFGGKKTRAK